MSQVYLVRHNKLEQYRVIKCIQKQHSMFDQLSFEADLLQHQKHPSFPELYDIEEDDENLYLIEEYIQGESLQAYLLAHKEISQTFIIYLGIHICKIIEFLHEQKPDPVLYLDFKPEHVLICGEEIRLIDFGMCQRLNQQYCVPGGTIGFVSSHIQQGKKPTIADDIFGIGSVLYYAATGKMIQDTDCDEKISNQLKKIIKKTTDSDAPTGYSCVADLRMDLEKLTTSSNLTREKYWGSQIAVIGSENRIGVTHFCISLVCYLNEKRRDAIYKEYKKQTCLHALETYMRGVSNREGKLKYLSFRGAATYGEAIDWPEDKYSVEVVDYGRYQETEQDEIMAADKIFIVVGTKPWELEKTKELVKQFQFCEKAQFVLNFTGMAAARQFVKETGLKGARFVYDEDPFVVTKAKKRLFTAILPEKWR